MNKKNLKTKIIILSAILLWNFSSLVSVSSASEINNNNVIKFVNAAREKDGLKPLSENGTLDEIAQAKLDDMIAHGYFAHTSPQGITPWYWYEKAGYDYKYAGENLAINFLTAETQQKAWMDSASHRKNILNVNYQEIGIAVGAGEINGQTSIITVQEFGSPANGVVVAKSDNFSGSSQTNLIKEGELLGPSVLSIKEARNNQMEKIKNDKQKLMGDLGKYLKENKTILASYLWIIAFLIFMSSAVIMPLGIMAYSVFHRLSLSHLRRKIYVAFKDNINEIRTIKIHMT